MKMAEEQRMLEKSRILTAEKSEFQIKSKHTKEERNHRLAG